jgi:PAS domain-containing protein
MAYLDFTKNAEGSGYALVVARAMLEAAADGILATGEHGRVIGLNTKFLEMWRIPEELVELRDVKEFRTIVAEQLKNPEDYLGRIAEIGVSGGKALICSNSLTEGISSDILTPLRLKKRLLAEYGVIEM